MHRVIVSRSCGMFSLFSCTVAMYGTSTREISLLQRFGAALRQAETTMYPLQAHLEYQKETAWPEAETYGAYTSLSRVLLDGHTLKEESRHFGTLGRSGIARRFAHALKSFVAEPPPRLPQGPYALVVDGVYFTFERKEWVLYLMAVKPVRSHRMYFLDPVLVKGRERLSVWDDTFAALPKCISKQIRALVSDGLPGFPELAARNGWVYQRCHFHLLASLVRSKGMRRYRTRGSAVRERVLASARILLADKSKKHSHARAALLRYANDPACPAYVRKHVKELLLREEDFRAYLMYSDLSLPTTTNAMESSGKLVRKATRTARTPESLLLRATAFLQLKRSVTCNGSCDTQK